MKEKIDYNTFTEAASKLEITVGKILSAERIKKTDKLIKLLVDFGAEQRVAVTNLGEELEPEAFVGVTLPFITNLSPVKMMGVESHAMIMPGTSIDGQLELGVFSLGSKLL